MCDVINDSDIIETSLKDRSNTTEIIYDVLKEGHHGLFWDRLFKYNIPLSVNKVSAV